MKIRKSHSSGTDKIEIQMTPMIDIVFQLLSFFIMSFRVVAMEGDFNIKMPLVAEAAGKVDDSSVVQLKLEMKAGPGGELASMTLNGTNFANFKELHDYIASIVDRESGPAREGFEVEIAADYQLKYENIVKAVTAVSGYRRNDQIVKLIEKIKFSPLKAP